MPRYSDESVADTYKVAISRLRNARHFLQEHGALFALCGLEPADISNIKSYASGGRLSAFETALATEETLSSAVQGGISSALASLQSKLDALEI